MAKKVRRVKKSKQTAVSATGNENEALAAAPETAPPALRSRQASTEEQFREEYAYVIRDLRQVLLLSVVMFALLIVLNLLLN